MAMQAMTWLEGITGVDITGRSELNEYLGIRNCKHVSAEGGVPDDVRAQDQILDFMETGLQKLDLSPSEVEELLALNVQYTNTLNAVYFHNDQIHLLLDQLVENRAAYKASRTQENRLRVFNTKLDIEERLNKRYNKQSEHSKVEELMKSLISKYQLEAFVKLQQSGGAPPTPPTERPDSPAGSPAAYIKPEVVCHSPKLRRRLISKKEIKQFLMDD
eukprot:TRINITY_DN33889_c0_g1_i1.p1 TRINITY_DN33889_c0_g1~~TRINITY_DN33889_c0_g1_i1.p1  ORF type:complete len:250 (+),score=59.44 TRINITY_DN33889_c0_g1_i1:100-750(+)